MFGWLRRKTAPEKAPVSIRDTLFGDMPIAKWGGHEGVVWDDFAKARCFLDNGQTDDAIAALSRVLATPSLESRHYLQAWHFLRQLGRKPPIEQSKRVLGVVVEVSMKGGIDLLAAYEDHSSRYYNYSGSGVVMDIVDPAIVVLIDNLLAAARVVVAEIGPWEQPRPSVPPPGAIRLNVLTPSGLHFGQGPFDVMAKEHLAAPVIAAATELMLALMQKGLNAQQKKD